MLSSTFFCDISDFRQYLYNYYTNVIIFHALFFLIKIYYIFNAIRAIVVRQLVCTEQLVRLFKINGPCRPFGSFFARALVHLSRKKTCVINSVDSNTRITCDDDCVRRITLYSYRCVIRNQFGGGFLFFSQRISPTNPPAVRKYKTTFSSDVNYIEYKFIKK